MGSSESFSPKCISPVVVKCYPGCTPNKDRMKAKTAPTLKKFFCRDNKLKSVLKLHNRHLKFADSSKDAKKSSAVGGSCKKGEVKFFATFVVTTPALHNKVARSGPPVIGVS